MTAVVPSSHERFILLLFLFHILLQTLAPCNAFVVPPPSQPSTPTIFARRRPSALAAARQRSPTTSNPKKNYISTSPSHIQVGERIGKGSFGCVHWIHILNPSTSDTKSSTAAIQNVIGKRAWTSEELQATSSGSAEQRASRCKHYWKVEQHCFEKLKPNAQLPPYRGSQVDELGREWMLFDVVVDGDDSKESKGEDEGESTRGKGGRDLPVPARTLGDVMKLDWQNQHHQTNTNKNGENDLESQTSQPHRLTNLQKALGLSPETSTLSTTLDTLFTSLLQILSYTHSFNIVHRDIKPTNLLITPHHQLVLIDFGSAADLDPIGWISKTRIGLEQDNLVAISPVYAAPETFVRPDKSPLQFDVYSTAMLYCQFVFNYLDERTDAGFHQQLQNNAVANHDLDAWLDQELLSKVRPAGLEDALEYIGDRPGLWRLLGDMLKEDPRERVASKEALDRWEIILRNYEQGVVVEEEGELWKGDGEFFHSVLESMEFCEIPEDWLVWKQNREGGRRKKVQEASSTSTVVTTPRSTAAATSTSTSTSTMQKPSTTTTTTTPTTTTRPLHYVATFSRSSPLGLILCQYDEALTPSEFSSPQHWHQWEQATQHATPKQVFVKEVLSDGQADQLGIIEIGDRLQGVGELPLGGGGFEKVMEMLERQPRKAKTVKLHFDRLRHGGVVALEEATKQQQQQLKRRAVTPHPVTVADQGAWSAKGRRNTQEDAFVLHEINPLHDRPILLAGVMDGHGGTAAATMVSETLPNLLSHQCTTTSTSSSSSSSLPFVKTKSKHTLQPPLPQALEAAWTDVCNTYRQTCNEESCAADYDPREGILQASTGSKDMIAGTTASVVALEERTGEVVVLNCGDSRSLVVQCRNNGGDAGVSDGNGKKKWGKVVFATTDHSPETEMQRFQEGQEQGYSMPECRLSRWRVPVGDYVYTVSRSLEGTFATSKGIVSDADVSCLSVVQHDENEEEVSTILVVATDGVWEVMDSQEVAMDVANMRARGVSAGDAAKTLCSMALEKGSMDNMSAVIVYLE